MRFWRKYDNSIFKIDFGENMTSKPKIKNQNSITMYRYLFPNVLIFNHQPNYLSIENAYIVGI